MKKIWFDEAWEDYTYWQAQDKKTLKRINMLLRDIERGNFDGIGKPEPLKGDMSGFWSRHAVHFYIHHSGVISPSVTTLPLS